MVVTVIIELALLGGTNVRDSMECVSNVEAMIVEFGACVRATQDLLHRPSKLMRHSGDVCIALSICVDSTFRCLITE